MKLEDFGYKVENNILAFQKGPLSQWWKSEFRYCSKKHSAIMKFNCCEQFMMFSKAMLFQDIKTGTEIMLSNSPKEQKSLGRKVKNYNQEIWDQKKYDIVRIGNILKFSQDEELKKFLVSTDGLVLVEAAPWDKIWGCGTGLDDPKTYDKKKWQGENLLGKALIAARQRIIEIDKKNG